MMGRRILITAHAGCMGTEPNSEASFKAAYASPADIVEADIRITADGIPILAHDETMALPGSGGSMTDARVDSMDWRVDRKDFDSADIMDFEEFLDLVARLDAAQGHRSQRPRILNLDMKDKRAIGPVAQALRRRGLVSRALLTGLYPEDLELARHLSPDAIYLLNAERMVATGMFAMGIEDTLALAEEFGCAGINLEWSIANPEIMEAAKRRNMPVYLWTVDDAVQMRRAALLGPYSITSNQPSILADILGEVGEEP
ncbi:MAG: glycerophosphoryl diester phosphodiesterase [Spirochaetes bacterium]|nr:MAG: glycerophosphoryl diester phosphodiesterase [Spirochaetota bacterium]